MKLTFLVAILIFSLATPSFADLTCRVIDTDIVCKEDQKVTKSLVTVVARYVIIPLVETATEEIVKRAIEAWTVKYGHKPIGKVVVK